MSETPLPEQQPGQVPPTVPTPASEPAVPQDYAELKAFREQYEPVLNAIAPIWDEDIAPILNDEEQRSFAREARKAYKERLENQKPKIPAELQPAIDELRTSIAPALEYINAEKAAKEATQKAASEAAQRVNLEFAQRIVAERPDLAEHNFAGVTMLAAVAQRDNISLEDAWKQYGATMTAPVKREKPPTSLRGDGGAPGVPGESTAPKAVSRNDILNRLKKNISAAKGA